MPRGVGDAGAPSEQPRCAAPAVPAAVAEAACNDAQEADALSELPLVLLARVLSALLPVHAEKGDAAPRALLRLAACSKHLRDAVASADDVWQALCRARGWAACARTGAPLASPPPGFAFWQAAFVHKRSRLCIECGTLTPYVFPLLSPTFRLCERCEPGSPRYALLTAAQACEAHFGLSRDDLAALPCREVRGLRSPAVEKRLRVLGQATLYLRSHVVALAEAKQRAAAAHAPRGSDSEAEEEEEEDGEQFRLDGDDGDDDDDGKGDGDGRGRSGSRTAKLTPEASRAARKANKAAVKASNRERRQAKNSTPTKAPEAGAAEPKRYFALSASPLGGNGGGGGGSSFGGRASGSSLPARAGASPPMSGGNGGARRSKGAHARDAARARDAGTSPTSAGPLTRAWLEDELGAFGISGLELAL